MGRYPGGVSMTHAAEPHRPPGYWEQGSLSGTVYLNAGQVRVLLERNGCRLDLAWQEWGDLVAGVGERFVGMAMVDPYVIEAARNSLAWAAAQAANTAAGQAPGD